ACHCDCANTVIVTRGPSPTPSPIDIVPCTWSQLPSRWEYLKPIILKVVRQPARNVIEELWVTAEEIPFGQVHALPRRKFGDEVAELHSRFPSDGFPCNAVAKDHVDVFFLQFGEEVLGPFRVSAGFGREADKDGGTIAAAYLE